MSCLFSATSQTTCLRATGPWVFTVAPYTSRSSRRCRCCYSVRDGKELRNRKDEVHVVPRWRPVPLPSSHHSDSWGPVISSVSNRPHRIVSLVVGEVSSTTALCPPVTTHGPFGEFTLLPVFAYFGATSAAGSPIFDAVLETWTELYKLWASPWKKKRPLCCAVGEPWNLHAQPCKGSTLVTWAGSNILVKMLSAGIKSATIMNI